MEQKYVLQSKTIIFNGLVLVLAVAAGLGFKDFAPSEQVAEAGGLLTTFVVALVPVINIALRAVTDTGITLSKD
jgi:hypothetical protein